MFAAIGVFYFAPLLPSGTRRCISLRKAASFRAIYEEANYRTTTPHEPEYWSDVRDGPKPTPPSTGGWAAATLLFWTRLPERSTGSWRIMKANWVVWPLPSFVNLALVPLDYRVLFLFLGGGGRCCRCLRSCGCLLACLFGRCCAREAGRRDRASRLACLAGRTLVVYYGLIPGLSSSRQGARGLGRRTARRRVVVAAAGERSKARSPRPSQPWHARRTEERRRCGDVLAFSALGSQASLAQSARHVDTACRQTHVLSTCIA